MATKQIKRSKTIEYYDYSELAKEVCQLLGRDIRDYDGSHGHFGRWCDATGRGQTDPEGKHRNSSQVWYAEYRADPNGEAASPEYRDFWHWWLKYHEIENGGYEDYNNFVEIRTDLMEDGDYDADEHDWIIEILDTFIQVLGDDADKEITLHYYW